MRFNCSIQQRGDQWAVRHAGSDLGDVEVTAPTRDEALDKMRNELRYRLELCPCTGEVYQHVNIELVEQSG